MKIKDRWLKRWSCLVMLAVLVMVISTRAKSEPVFNPDGSITCGNKSVILTPDGFVYLKAGAKEFPCRIYGFTPDPKTNKFTSWFTSNSLKNKTHEVSEYKKESVFKGTYIDPESGKSVELRISISLNSEGMVVVEQSYNRQELFPEGVVRLGNLYIHQPYKIFKGHTIKLDDRIITFVSESQIRLNDKVINFEQKETDERVLTIRETCEKLILFADTPEFKMTLFTMKKGTGVIVDVSKQSQLVYIPLPELFKIDLSLAASNQF